MSEPREDGRYEAPVGRLAGTRASERRARIAAAVAVVALGSAIALAIAPGAAPSPTPPAVALRGSGPPTGSRNPSPEASSGPVASRVETLEDVPDRVIPGAPSLVLIEQHGIDARIVRWTAGQGLAVTTAFPGAFAALEGVSVYPVLSPTSDRLFILWPGGGDDDTGDHGRLVDAAGVIRWDGDGLAALSGALWSADGRVVVAAAKDGTWRLITVDASGAATARSIALPTKSVPIPTPNDRFGPLVIVPRTLPLGFSADGRWIYGGVVSPQLATITTEFRVATDGTRSEAVATLGVGRPDGLAPASGTLGGRLVDPIMGRIAEWRTNTDYSGGPPSIDVRNADGTFAYVVDVGTPLGSAWDGHGRLYVLSADSIIFPDETRLVPVGPAGRADPPLYQTGPVADASLVGVRDGVAALAFSVSRPVAGSQLILVDVAHADRRAGIRLPNDADWAIVGLDLRP
ncbi:MAG TPA: hypothetical protein VNM34_04310 [Verrucomicrobiae bacterium]|nr:hypothetical protein [Verrucomicrobiae bacterium]